MEKREMVGEEVVKQYSGINGLQEGAGQKTLLKPRVIFARRPHPMWTYFIRGPEGIKIGKSRNPEERKRGLQLAHASELEIIIAVPESVLSETAGHEMFKHLKMSGEWFRPEPDLLAFIETLKAQPLEPKIVATEPTPKPEPSKPRPSFCRVKAAAPDPVVGKLQSLRSAHGHDTPIGHRCSNLAQMISAYRAADDPDRRKGLAASIRRTSNELQNLTEGF
jgi:hypothetical protein